MSASNLPAGPPMTFQEQVAQAIQDLFNEWMRLGDQRQTWMIFIAPRVAAAFYASRQSDLISEAESLFTRALRGETP